MPKYTIRFEGFVIETDNPQDVISLMQTSNVTEEPRKDPSPGKDEPRSVALEFLRTVDRLRVPVKTATVFRELGISLKSLRGMGQMRKCIARRLAKYGIDINDALIYHKINADGWWTPGPKIADAIVAIQKHPRTMIERGLSV